MSGYTPCVIRHATPADAPALALHAARLFRQAYGPTHPEPTMSAYLAQSITPEVFAALIARSDTSMLIAQTEAGDFAGYAHVQVGAPADPTTVVVTPLPGSVPLEIARFYVDAQWHGLGVAQALMAECDTVARERGADCLWLQAWQEASRALAFYHKAGFRIHGRAEFLFGSRRDHDHLLARPVVRS